MTMVELLKWLSHGSVYVNVIRKSNNSPNNSSHGIPTKYRLGPWFWGGLHLNGVQASETSPSVSHQH